MKASGASGRRSTLIALASTVVFVVVIGLVVTNAPGWPEVKKQFFDGEVFRDSLETIPKAFLLNVKIFLIAEALILPFALLIAVLRSLQGPVFFPLRALAIVYADLFRGLPTILVVYMLGFGVLRSGSAGFRSTPSSGASPRSCSSTPRTSARSTAPGSSPCTPARRPPRARSGSRT